MSVIIEDEAEAAELGEWMRAYRRHGNAIVTHPLFPKLVREVAIDEQPGRRWGYRHSSEMRSQRFALRIADDLEILPTLPWGERAARVYVEARDHVRLRLNGRP